MPEYGSIVWSRRDPKTWELTNTEQAQAPSQTPVEQQLVAEMLRSGASRSDSPAGLTPNDAAVLNSRGGVGYLEEGTPETRREWRRGVRNVLRSLKKYGDYDVDTNQAMQELIDSGAVRYGDNGQPGLASNMSMRLSEKDRQIMVEMADRWADSVGLYRDGQFDPSGYRPYNSIQQRRMYEGRWYWGSEEDKREKQRQAAYEEYLKTYGGN